MKHPSKIQIISARLYRFFFVLAILLPAFTAGFWLLYDHLPRHMVSMAMPAGIPVPVALGLAQQLLGLLVSLIPLGVEMAALLTLMTLMKLYLVGDIFSRRHVACYKRLGRCLVWYTIARVVHGTALGLVLTMNNPPGQHMLNIGVSSDDLTLLAVAAIVLMLAWIMDEGRKLAEDQALTI